MRENKHTTKFSGFTGPNYTPVPDALFDELLPELSGAELKVLLYIIRRTFGFKRESDHISLSQMLNGIRTRDDHVLDHGVGLSKKTLLAAINSLEKRDIVFTERRRSVERGDEPTSYRLNVIDGPRGGKTTLPVGEKLHQGGGVEITPGPWGKNSATQETGLQETAKQQTALASKNSNGSKNSMVTEEQKQGKDKRPRGGLTPIGETLAMRRPGRPRKTSPTPELDAAVEEVSEKLRDWHHLRSNLTQARRLMEQNGLEQAELAQVIYEALAITADRQDTVQRPMAYLFELVRKRLERLSDQTSHHQAVIGDAEETANAAAAWVPLAAEQNPQQLWDAVRLSLAEQVTRPIFETYVRDAREARNVDGQLHISVPSAFMAEWLSVKLRPLVLQQLQSVSGAPLAVQFDVDEHGA